MAVKFIYLRTGHTGQDAETQRVRLGRPAAKTADTRQRRKYITQKGHHHDKWITSVSHIRTLTVCGIRDTKVIEKREKCKNKERTHPEDTSSLIIMDINYYFVK